MLDYATNIANSSITEDELAAILGNTNYGIRILKKDFIVSYINEAFARLSGVSPEKAIGKKCWQVFPGPLCNTEDCRLKRILNGDKLLQYEIERKTESGALVSCRVVAIPCYTREGELTSMIEMFIDISERKQLEAQLIKSKERYEISDRFYKSVIQNTSEGFLLLKHPEGNIIDANDSMCRILGYSRDDLLSMNIKDIDVDFVEAPEKVSQRLVKVKKDGVSLFEVRHRNKDGKIIDLEVSQKYIDIGGGVAFCLHRDITEQKELYRRLKESEEKYRLIAENVTDVIFTQTLDGVSTYISPSVKHLRGYTVEEAMAQKGEEKLTPESLKEAKEVQLEALAADQKSRASDKAVRAIEMEMLCKDGSTVWVEAKTDFIRDEDGKPIGVVGVCRDLTERRKAEKALRESEGRYRLLADNITDVIYIHDMDFNYTYISPSVKQLRGYTPEEAINQKPDERATPESRARARRVMNKALEADEKESNEKPVIRATDIEMYCKDGSTVWVEAKTDFIRGPDRKPVGVLGILRDITERKEAEKKLKSLVSKEKRLSHQLEKEIKQRVEFTRLLVHELKTPLTSMIASSEMLSRQLDSDLQTIADTLYSSSNALNKRVDELMDIARGEIGTLVIDPKPSDVFDVIRKATANLSYMFDKNKQGFTLNLDKTELIINIDPERISQVLSNLLVNASKFTPEGGAITLRTKTRARLLVVEIEDEGLGVTDSEKQKIFEPYYSPKSQSKHYLGMGLGLALAKNIIKLHGGDIGVRDASKKGSIFSFSLPVKNKRVK